MIAVAGGIIIVLLLIGAGLFGLGQITEGNGGCGWLVLAAVVITILFIIF